MKQPLATRSIRTALLSSYYDGPDAVRRLAVRLRLAAPTLDAGTPEPRDGTVWQTVTGSRTIVRDDALAARWLADGPVYLHHGAGSHWWELCTGPDGALTWPLDSGLGDPCPWSVLLTMGDLHDGGCGPIRPGPAWVLPALRQQVTAELTRTAAVSR